MKTEEIFGLVAIIFSFVFMGLAIDNFPNKYSMVYAFISLGFLYNSFMWNKKDSPKAGGGEVMRKCEWKTHKGENPPRLTKKETKFGWWLKDPEWVWMCPKCQNSYWKKFIRKYKKSNLKKHRLLKFKDSHKTKEASDKIDCKKHGLTLKENGECYKCKIYSLTNGEKNND